jgi:hypothetical protein
VSSDGGVSVGVVVLGMLPGPAVALARLCVETVGFSLSERGNILDDEQSGLEGGTGKCCSAARGVPCVWSVGGPGATVRTSLPFGAGGVVWGAGALQSSGQYNV